MGIQIQGTVTGIPSAFISGVNTLITWMSSGSHPKEEGVIISVLNSPICCEPGVSKSIIVFSVGPMFFTMFNPEIIASSDPYETEEGCLSLDGVRKTTRYENITVKYQTRSFETKIQQFSGWAAQIIQHEIDHLNGIII